MDNRAPKTNHFVLQQFLSDVDELIHRIHLHADDMTSFFYEFIAEEKAILESVKTPKKNDARPSFEKILQYYQSKQDAKSVYTKLQPKMRSAELEAAVHKLLAELKEVGHLPESALSRVNNFADLQQGELAQLINNLIDGIKTYPPVIKPQKFFLLLSVVLRDIAEHVVIHAYGNVSLTQFDFNHEKAKADKVMAALLIGHRLCELQEALDEKVFARNQAGTLALINFYNLIEGADANALALQVVQHSEVSTQPVAQGILKEYLVTANCLKQFNELTLDQIRQKISRSQHEIFALVAPTQVDRNESASWPRAESPYAGLTKKLSPVIKAAIRTTSTESQASDTSPKQLAAEFEAAATAAPAMVAYFPSSSPIKISSNQTPESAESKLLSPPNNASRPKSFLAKHWKKLLVIGLATLVTLSVWGIAALAGAVIMGVFAKATIVVAVGAAKISSGTAVGGGLAIFFGSTAIIASLLLLLGSKKKPELPKQTMSSAIALTTVSPAVTETSENSKTRSAQLLQTLQNGTATEALTQPSHAANSGSTSHVYRKPIEAQMPALNNSSTQNLSACSNESQLPRP